MRKNNINPDILSMPITSPPTVGIDPWMIIEQTGSYIFTKDTQGRYTYVNSKVQDLFGLSSNEIIGKDDSHFFDVALANDILRIDRLVLDQGQTVEQEERAIVKATGETRHFLAVKKPILDQQGQIIGLCGICTDITAEKQVQNTLIEQAKQLQAADERKDKFLAMLAHELRNPLAPIRNAVYILKQASTDQSRISWCSNIIDRQSEHLIGLVDDLLDVSRISRGLVELKKESLIIRDLISSAVESCQPMIDTRRQKLVISLPPSPLWVAGDRIRLTQVLANLINNASKFSDLEGRIDLSVDASAEHIHIRVADDGCGLDAEDIANLFDMFYQVERNLALSKGGLGIGLSLVQSLVKQHGGEVHAFSAGLGQGSKFTVCLPRLITSTSAKPTNLAIKVSTPELLRILVVDDNYDVAESTALLLETIGYQVLTASDGLTALEKVHVEQPDVAIIDIGLPGMDGYAVANALRSKRQLHPMLLIAFSGYGQYEDKKKSLAAGFDAHLIKPLALEELWKLLHAYARGEFSKSL